MNNNRMNSSENPYNSVHKQALAPVHKLEIYKKTVAPDRAETPLTSDMSALKTASKTPPLA